MDNLQREYQAQYNMQSALQKQEIEAEQAVHAPYMQQQSQMVQAALVEQINPDKILDGLELCLRGLKTKYDGTLVKSGRPLMNNEGVGEIMTYLRGIVHQHMIMTALEKEQIGKLILRISETIVDKLTLNYRQFEIDKTELDSITDIIEMNAFAALSRAKDGGERRFLGTTTIENISSAPKMQPVKKEGFLSRFRL